MSYLEFTCKNLIIWAMIYVLYAFAAGGVIVSEWPDPARVFFVVTCLVSTIAILHEHEF